MASKAECWRWPYTSQTAPPTANYEKQDPECDLDYVPNTPRKVNIEYALSNSFGFGGTNAALLMKRYTEAE